MAERSEASEVVRAFGGTAAEAGERPKMFQDGCWDLALMESWTVCRRDSPDRLRRTRSRLLHDFRTEPRVWREDREILLCSRMLPLNQQEAASGDAE